MKINIKKTKAMVISKKPNSPKINIAIDGQRIEQVTSYVYLGILITEDWRSEKEIKRRIMIARPHSPTWEHYYRVEALNLKTRMDNYKISVVQTWRVWDVGLSQSFENIMDGKDYQLGNIEKGRNRQRNSETIQDKETTISRTSNET